MFHIAQEPTANLLWISATKFFEEVTSTQASRSGNTREVLHAALTLQNPRERWIASRRPAMNPAFALAEVIWIVQGRQDSAFLNYFNPNLPIYAGDGPQYHGAYGFRLRNHLGFDQIERACEALSSNHDSRQIVLQIWDGRIDFPSFDGTPASKDIPCNVASLLKIRENRLEWTQIMRSNDIFLGLPHNIVQFTSLQEIVSGCLEIELGEYSHYSDSLHLYEHNFPLSIDNTVSLPNNSDKLSCPSSESRHSFSTLESFTESLINASFKQCDILKFIADLPLRDSFKNVARIIAADHLRRCNNPGAAFSAIDACTNEALNFMMLRWMQRKNTTRVTDRFV